MRILENLCDDSAPSEEDADAQNVYNTILSHPLVREISISTNANYMDVKTQPISLKNPYGEGSLPLGCLIIRLHCGGSYDVYTDESVTDTVSGRSPALGAKIHPHVSSGHVCIGNASSIVNQLHRDKNIPMFITFMLEFLQTYDRRSPYWNPWFKEPCRECGQLNTAMCRWCVCAQCSSKNNDKCGGCARWKTQSAGAACAYIKNLLNNRVNQMDEDDFIDAVRKTEELFKQ